MSVSETALQIDCKGDALVGIVSQPADGRAVHATGMVIVVGGPQYRVGSHRQFVLLAWRLAQAGFAVLRFDYRGMGDSDGAPRDFEAVQDDIAAAILALQQTCPAVREVALFGLCDGASAALMYVGPRGRGPAADVAEPKVAGLCLLNPWVRSQATLARTHLKHHYARRLTQADFWRKLGSGGLQWRKSARELLGNLRQTLAAGASPAGEGGTNQDSLAAMPFQQQMAAAFRSFPGQLLLVLSGNDYTAKEFLDCAAADPQWQGSLQRTGLQRLDLPTADHTFSTAVWRTEVEQSIVLWMNQLNQLSQPRQTQAANPP
jgi:exosortase A-associated hydrolase 1